MSASMAAFDGISYLNFCYHIVKFHYNLVFGMVTTVNQMNMIAKHHDSKKPKSNINLHHFTRDIISYFDLLVNYVS